MFPNAMHSSGDGSNLSQGNLINRNQWDISNGIDPFAFTQQTDLPQQNAGNFAPSPNNPQGMVTSTSQGNPAVQVTRQGDSEEVHVMSVTWNPGHKRGYSLPAHLHGGQLSMATSSDQMTNTHVNHLVGPLFNIPVSTPISQFINTVAPSPVSTHTNTFVNTFAPSPNQSPKSATTKPTKSTSGKTSKKGVTKRSKSNPVNTPVSTPSKKRGHNSFDAAALQKRTREQLALAYNSGLLTPSTGNGNARLTNAYGAALSVNSSQSSAFPNIALPSPQATPTRRPTQSNQVAQPTPTTFNLPSTNDAFLRDQLGFITKAYDNAVNKARLEDASEHKLDPNRSPVLQGRGLGPQAVCHGQLAHYLNCGHYVNTQTAQCCGSNCQKNINKNNTANNLVEFAIGRIICQQCDRQTLYDRFSRNVTHYTTSAKRFYDQQVLAGNIIGPPGQQQMYGIFRVIVDEDRVRLGLAARYLANCGLWSTPCAAIAEDQFVGGFRLTASDVTVSRPQPQSLVRNSEPPMQQPASQTLIQNNIPPAVQQRAPQTARQDNSLPSLQHDSTTCVALPKRVSNAVAAVELQAAPSSQDSGYASTKHTTDPLEEEASFSGSDDEEPDSIEPSPRRQVPPRFERGHISDEMIAQLLQTEIDNDNRRQSLATNMTQGLADTENTTKDHTSQDSSHSLDENIFSDKNQDNSFNNDTSSASPTNATDADDKSDSTKTPSAGNHNRVDSLVGPQAADPNSNSHELAPANTSAEDYTGIREHFQQDNMTLDPEIQELLDEMQQQGDTTVLSLSTNLPPENILFQPADNAHPEIGTPQREATVTPPSSPDRAEMLAMSNAISSNSSKKRFIAELCCEDGDDFDDVPQPKRAKTSPDDNDRFASEAE